MENLALTTLNELRESTNPAILLARFYSMSFSRPNTLEVIKMFNKLVTMYGRDIVFESLLDMYNMNDIDFTNIYGLIAYICKSNVNKKETKNTSENITHLAEENAKALERARRRQYKFKELT